MSRALKLWFGLAAVLSVVFCGSQLAEIPARSALRGYDNTFNYLWLRSAAVDGDWDFRNDLAAANTLVPEHRASALALPLTPAGRTPNKYGIGWATLTFPFYLIADAAVATGRWAGWWSVERDGFGPAYQIAVQLGHFALGLVALFLAASTVARWVGSREAAWTGVLTVWLGSSLLYYQTINVSMSHGAAFFAASVLAWALERARRCDPAEARGMRYWLLAGAAFGLAVITRFQLVVLGVVLVGAVFARGVSRRGSEQGTEGSGRWLRGREIAWLAIGAAPFLLLQAWAWRVVYGEWWVFGYGAEGEAFHWAKPEVLNSLFSSWHGLFYWHPFLLVGLVGFVGWAWTRREQALAWCVVFAATIAINSAWWCWWFASSFGNRGYDVVILPLMAGVAWLFARSGQRARDALWLLAGAAAAWNVYLVTLYRTGAISRHAPVTWAEMLAAAARLPEALRF
jgi:hypothetical protein